MASERPEILVLGPRKPFITDALAKYFTLHITADAPDREAMVAEVSGRVRGIAITLLGAKADGAMMEKMPHLEIVSTFGVGYDHVDAAWAGKHGVIVTHTPDVLNEEVADTAIGLLLCTLRELPQAAAHAKAGAWETQAYPLSRATLRGRTIGIIGMGRIGRAIARRLEGFSVEIAYHARHKVADLGYRHYPKLVDLARDVDTLIAIVPGGSATHNMVDAAVLRALGPEGVLINVARGSVVDEPALIEALKNKTILAAGLDVFADEPRIPATLRQMDNVVLLPHIASASVHTRQMMDQLVIDNLVAWFSGKPPLTPVPETPREGARNFDDRKIGDRNPGTAPGR